MLSLERCRTLLGADCRLTDAQIERLRDQVRVMAEIIIDTMKAPGTASQFDDAAWNLTDSNQAKRESR
jgi:hypothetical protein